MVAGVPVRRVVDDLGRAVLNDALLYAGAARYGVALTRQPWGEVFIAVCASLTRPGALHYVVVDERGEDPELFDPCADEHRRHTMDTLRRSLAYTLSVVDLDRALDLTRQYDRE